MELLHYQGNGGKRDEWKIWSCITTKGMAGRGMRAPH
jgi:hypothetical protein